MQQSNVYLGIYTIEYYFILEKSGCYKGPLVIWTDTFGETSMGTVKLEEVIEKPFSDVLAHTSEVCKSIPLDQRVTGCQG
jgi:hypothetical protein